MPLVVPIVRLQHPVHQWAFGEYKGQVLVSALSPRSSPIVPSMATFYTAFDTCLEHIKTATVKLSQAEPDLHHLKTDNAHAIRQIFNLLPANSGITVLSFVSILMMLLML